MAEIVIVGIGPGTSECLTLEAQRVLEEAPRLFFRFSYHPVARDLINRGKEFISFEKLYADKNLTYKSIYELMVKTLITEAKRNGRVVFVLPGNPYVFEKTPRWLLERIKEEDDIRLVIIPGMSFLELLYPILDIDPEEGLVILNGARMVEFPERYAPVPRLACIIGQFGLPFGAKPGVEELNVAPIVNVLLKYYPPEHPAIILRAHATGDYSTALIKTQVGKLTDLMRLVNFVSSLYLPPIED